jgi:glycosyltransferase involved in cell wall biosynthesis
MINLFENATFHATTEDEKADIRAIFGDKVNIKIAGNLPQKKGLTEIASKIKSDGNLKLINIARIAPEKNLLYALRVLKQVKGSVTFDFYGPVYDTNYWKECKDEIMTLPENVKVSYKGSLESEKVLIEFQNYHFLFLPTQGENFGHIILQSLSAGCPVIISDQTPWRNLKQKNIGFEFTLSEPDKFVETIDNCIRMDSETYDKFSRAAFSFAKSYIDDPQILEQNRQLFL